MDLVHLASSLHFAASRFMVYFGRCCLSLTISASQPKWTCFVAVPNCLCLLMVGRQSANQFPNPEPLLQVSQAVACAR